MIPLGVLASAYVAPAGGVGGAPSPGDLSGLRVWLDPNSLSGADGDPVSAWINTSGIGDNYSVSSGSPVLSRNWALPAVRFDGTGLLTDAFGRQSLGQDQTVFVVASTAVTGAERSMVGSSGTGLRLYLNSTAKPVAGEWGGAWKTAIHPTAVSANQLYVYALRWNNFESIEIAVNGGTPTLTATTTTTDPDRAYAVGGYAGTNASWVGDIGEFVLTYGALSDTDLAGVATFLMQKWGIS